MVPDHLPKMFPRPNSRAAEKEDQTEFVDKHAGGDRHTKINLPDAPKMTTDKTRHQGSPGQAQRNGVSCRQWKRKLAQHHPNQQPDP